MTQDYGKQFFTDKVDSRFSLGQPTLTGLATLESVEVRHRGTIHIVELPQEFMDTTDPRTLTGQTVEVDGELHKVRGVEAFTVPWSPGSVAFKRVGLLL